MIEDIKVDFNNIIFDMSNIDNYSTQELIYFFNKFWIASKGKFSKEYNLNGSNFRQWSNGKKESAASVKAVKKFLSDRALNIQLYQDEVSDISLKAFSEILPNEDFYKNNQKVTISPSSLLIKIRDLASTSNLKTLIFIQSENLLKDISQLIPNDTIRTHIIVLISKKNHSTHMNSDIAKPWFSVIRARTICKNAVSTLLTMITSSLHLILPNSIKFVISAHGEHIYELKELIYDREVNIQPPQTIINMYNI